MGKTNAQVEKTGRDKRLSGSDKHRGWRDKRQVRRDKRQLWKEKRPRIHVGNRHARRTPRWVRQTPILTWQTPTYGQDKHQRRQDNANMDKAKANKSIKRRGRGVLASCQVSSNSVQRLHSRQNVSIGPIRGRARYICWNIGPKTQTCKRTFIACSLPSIVKFRSTAAEGKSRNVSANQRPGGHLCWWIGPKNTNLVKDVEYLIPIKFRSTVVEKLKKYLGQSEARAAIFVDGSAPKHKISRGLWVSAYCTVFTNSLSRLKRSRKCLAQTEASQTFLLLTDRPEKHNTW